MQLQAHNENAQIGVFSPLPGGSLHEAGRAFDLDLEALLKDEIITLEDFWGIARHRGLVPIIASPDPGKSEAWHFECRGSHAQSSPILPRRQGRFDIKALPFRLPTSELAAHNIWPGKHPAETKWH
jgi:hypothetical protein